jgi:hypothetical protein
VPGNGSAGWTTPMFDGSFPGGVYTVPTNYTQYHGVGFSGGTTFGELPFGWGVF